MLRNRFDDTTFGIKVYDKVLAQIEKQLHAEEPDFDIRALHVMYDHKVLMLERIKYQTVVRNMLTARNLLVRISITGEIESSVRFKTYLDAAKEKEISILFRILAELEDK